MWSKVKAQDGWQVCRVTLRRNDQILGGFQLLHKRKGSLRIGYVTKGPVWDAAAPAYEIRLIQLLNKTACELRLGGLIAQAPDASQPHVQWYRDAGYVPETIMEVIPATLVVPLTGGIEAVREQISKRTQYKIRKAGRADITVREGNAHDLSRFFSLMCESCKRQGNVAPNPASVEALVRIWDAFVPQGNIRVLFAEHSGRAVSAVLCLLFGNRLSIWKKGMLPDSVKLHAISLLYWEAMALAARSSLALVDFCSLRKDIAEDLIAGRPLNDEQLCSRDAFHLGFGGTPMLLPPPMIYIPNRAFRAMYRLGTRFKFARRLAKRFL